MSRIQQCLNLFIRPLWTSHPAKLCGPLFKFKLQIYHLFFRTTTGISVLFQMWQIKKDLSIEVQSDHSPLYVCRTCTVFAACLRRVFPILGQTSSPYLSLILTMCLQHKQPVTPRTFTISRRAEHPAQVRWLWYQLLLLVGAVLKCCSCTVFHQLLYQCIVSAGILSH